MKFLTDGMLGKLTRWLRMLGHDVKYSSDLEDQKLLEIAAIEDRTILTRDVQLFQRAASQQLKVFLVEKKSDPELLASLSKRFKFRLEIDPDNSKCPQCNTMLRRVEKDEITSEIPDNTRIHHDEFWQCSGCQKIYWRGSHWGRINKKLKEAQRIAGSEQP